MTSTCLSTIATMILLVTTAVASPSGFRQLGNTLVGSPALLSSNQNVPFDFGSTDDGSRMAVGAPNDNDGGVFLYERHTPLDSEDIGTESTWTLLWETHDASLGDSLALSDNGDYLVYRQKDVLYTYHAPSDRP